jgi:polyhydroxyalkanoate synthase
MLRCNAALQRRARAWGSQARRKAQSRAGGRLAFPPAEPLQRRGFAALFLFIPSGQNQPTRRFRRRPRSRSPMIRPRGPHPLPLFLATITHICGNDRARLAKVLHGLARYQSAPTTPPRPEHPEIARIGNVTLRAHSDAGTPLLVVPSLINPPDVLDLTPGNSLIGHLAATGFRPVMVDWGDTPEPLGLPALVTDRLVPLIASLGQPMPAIGYCLGGTLLLAAARAGGISHAALLATPWHFGKYPPETAAGIARWWQQARTIAAPLGLVPMDLLQPAFWSIDPATLASKFERIADADDEELTAFARLEDWANGGAPLSLAAAADLAALFERGGTGIGGADLPDIPLLDVVALADRIVPAAAAFTSPGHPARLEIASGHVGMVVGRNAPALLHGPLADYMIGR